MHVILDINFIEAIVINVDNKLLVKVVFIVKELKKKFVLYVNQDILWIVMVNV